MEKSFRKLSRAEWGLIPEADVKEASLEQIKLGALQRIADATEAMAKNFLQLQADLDYCRKYICQLEKANKSLKNSIKAEKSAKTRYKNKLNLSENEG